MKILCVTRRLYEAEGETSRKLSIFQIYLSLHKKNKSSADCKIEQDLHARIKLTIIIFHATFFF